ncbi:two-component system activity regulator YycH [Robertmurraya sp. DFI.2.37]|uniref:YycH family regulatory protein n=1 Tax=Robertmurraya sp. DFI.2.37 TaxID=3031819 RepID=UPI001247228B|nr:two-component system activity regulator YycH [Robertmurraya sp. DFI.2.37]MDF1510629.1 two-component system activity regulator YycH [Robertmurraya sp. DFI.2.37]
MTYENIKSIILTILVLLSVFLTWSIWTYQPNYESLDENKITPGVLISSPKEVRQIIKADRVFYHIDDEHYGTVYPGEIDRIIKELSTWNYRHFEQVTIQEEDLTDFLHENGRAQISFPSSVPMEIYKNILGIQDEDMSGIHFDQIIIEMKNVMKDSGYVYFVSLDEKKVYRSRVKSSFVTNFSEDFYQEADSNHNFEKYSLETLGDTKKLLVPTNEKTLSAHSYLIETIKGTEFRDALFRSPSFVQRNGTGYGEEFKDSTTLLSVNFETNILRYVNPTQEKDISVRVSTLLQNSIDFVNGHGGWTDNYYFVDIDQLEQTVLFRLYEASGYPIFNNSGMSEILQIWGRTAIHRYERNNFQMNRRVESTEKRLDSGVDILQKLKERKDIEPEFIQDLVIGYEMTRSSRDPVIHLEPIWYYKYQDQWLKVDNGPEGGNGNGLEQN